MATLNDVSRYALAYVPLLLLPIAAVAIDAGLPALAAALFPLGFLFLLVPAIELLTGRDAANHAPTQTGIADTAMHAALTWLMVPAWLLLLGWALGVPAGKEMDLLSTLVWFTSLGVVGGVCAINTAHELIHKPGRLEPGLGGILLASFGVGKRDDLRIKLVRIVDHLVLFDAACVELPIGDGLAIRRPSKAVAAKEFFFVNPIKCAVDGVLRAVRRQLRDFAVA